MQFEELEHDWGKFSYARLGVVGGSSCSVGANMRRVLIVEDDVDVRDALADICKFGQFTYVTAKNGIEALEVLARDQDFCAILLDIYMPIMSGRDFLANFVQYGGKIPVIITTGSEQCRNVPAGVTAVVHKPFMVDTLLGKLEALVKA